MKNNRKGFTIVELVIVIAVIGILAGVLIPTFSSITKSANESAALQQAKSGLQSILPLTGGALPEGTVFAVNSDDDGAVDYKFIYEGQKLNATTLDKATPTQPATANKYVIYVSTESLVKDDSVSNATVYKGFTASGVALLNSLLVTGETITETTALTSVPNGSHYEVIVKAAEGTVGTEGYVAAVKADVYFTSDIKGTMMVVLGSMD